jgi:hypothetical protein
MANNPNAAANLKRTPKGVSGNPNGRPPKKECARRRLSNILGIEVEKEEMETLTLDLVKDVFNLITIQGLEVCARLLTPEMRPKLDKNGKQMTDPKTGNLASEYVPNQIPLFAQIMARELKEDLTSGQSHNFIKWFKFVYGDPHAKTAEIIINGVSGTTINQSFILAPVLKSELPIGAENIVYIGLKEFPDIDENG